ncbi:MAG TPA: hypothetical protein PLY78_04210, partial [Methanospirillum sp.]|nr:hypothetical protein [Methanospirillum sp.]
HYDRIPFRIASRHRSDGKGDGISCLITISILIMIDISIEQRYSLFIPFPMVCLAFIGPSHSDPI